MSTWNLCRSTCSYSQYMLRYNLLGYVYRSFYTPTQTFNTDFTPLMLLTLIPYAQCKVWSQSHTSGWNTTDRALNINQVINRLQCFVIISPRRGTLSLIQVKLNSIHQRMFRDKYLFEITPVVLKKFVQVTKIFSVCNNLLLERIWTNPNFVNPKCNVTVCIMNFLV